ncbi:tetratricopeptide repeat protein [Coprobacter tertius]|uniref:Tetratricopeptide repeat protein n=1 Tax=Coprobacter tertius TaxID=2944915 RepID=A0ABT1MDN9_9BACT|nr:tetratricopeptide repeat protein [Coprobacter tertius]MCP9610759.1 tetratricopeptide repeat protein [Coprobacter tertius]
MSQEKKEIDELDKVNAALSNSEQFIQKYQKPILLVVLAIVIVVSAAIAIHHFYALPREEKAEAEMFKGVFYFEKDSFQLAIDGNGSDFVGFKAIADDYSSSNAGNLAAAYTGISLYNLGKYDEAIDYLKKFDADEEYIAPSIIGTIGDCYVNMDKLDDAIGYFEKAAKKADNEVLSPIYLKKAATVFEKQNKYDKALKAYQTIKEKYPKSVMARDIDKYIDRAEAKTK